MDVRLPFTSAGVCLALLLSGCSPSDEKRQVSLDEKTAQFETSLNNIQDPKLKNAIAELGGSLLLLERAQLKLDTKPLQTEYSEDVLAVHPSLACLKSLPASWTFCILLHMQVIMGTLGGGVNPS